MMDTTMSQCGRYTLHQKLTELAEQFPNQVVMNFKHDSEYLGYSYQTIYLRALRVAYYLGSLGIVGQDRVAIILDNSPEWGIVYFGIMFIGAIAIPIDPQSHRGDLEYFLHDSAAKLVFTQTKYAALIEEVAHQVSSAPTIVVVDDSQYDKLLQQVNVCVLPKVSGDDLASILYTSGTTGKPKGVMLSHQNFYRNFRSIEKLQLINRDHHLLSILPLHHSFPFMVTLLIPLFTGARVTYLQDLRTDTILQCMRESGVTVLVGVPQLFYLIHKQIEAKIKGLPGYFRIPFKLLIELMALGKKCCHLNLSKLVLSKIHQPFGKKLQFFVSGGAKLDVEVAASLQKLGFTILEGYGLTETSPAVTFNPLGKEKIGSAGKVIPDVEIKICVPDEQGRGEVAIHGPNVMRGYYHYPEATDAVLQDGWFYSGDIGYLDKDNYLYLVGRKKEIIVLSSGKNISPEEVENYYVQSNYIKELCVLALEKQDEEKLVAVIVPDYDYFRKRGEIGITETIRFELENYSKNYPAYRRIMGFVIAKEDLPRTRLGKLKRFLIKEQYLAQLLSTKSKTDEAESPINDEDLLLLSTPAAKVVFETIAKELNIQHQLKLSDHLELDLGIDSLSRVELIAAIERRIGTHLADEVLAKVFTLRELILAINNMLSMESNSSAKNLRTLTFSWASVLSQKPSAEIITKIDLAPSRSKSFFRAMVTLFLKIIFKIFGRLKIFGVENIPNEKKLVFCANHCSYLDGILMLVALPPRFRRRCFFLGLRIIFTRPFLQKFIRLMQIIPVDSAQYLLDALLAASYVLGHDQSVVIFPEGERSVDGEVKTFKKGVGILAKELQVDLVPVYISGSFQAWPRGQKLPRPYPIKIVFGKPCQTADLIAEGRKLGATDDYQAIAQAIQVEVTKLSVE